MPDRVWPEAALERLRRYLVEIETGLGLGARMGRASAHAAPCGPADEVVEFAAIPSDEVDVDCSPYRLTFISDVDGLTELYLLTRGVESLRAHLEQAGWEIGPFLTQPTLGANGERRLPTLAAGNPVDGYSTYLSGFDRQSTDAPSYGFLVFVNSACLIHPAVDENEVDAL